MSLPPNKSKAQRAQLRRQSASFLATDVDGNIVASGGSILEHIPATPEERGQAFLNLLDLCSWLYPDFDKPMDKTVSTIGFLKSKE